MIDNYPAIPNEANCGVYHQVRKINAQLSHFMHIEFPERLSDDEWAEKYRQFQWLAENNYLSIK